MTKITAEKLKELIGGTVKDQVHAAMKDVSEEFKKSQLAEAAKEENNTKEAKLKSGEFLRAVYMGDEAKLKDLSVGTDANGGYIVPTEFYNQLIERRYKAAFIRRFATVIPMSSDKMELGVEGNDVAVNWTTELATITQSDMTFAQVVLNVNLLAGLSRMSRQLLADAAINEGVAELVIRKFANKLGRAEDTAFMTGSGTGQPKGLRQYTISQTAAQAGANLVANDLTNLIHALPEQYRSEGTFILHDNILKLVRNLRSTTGEILFDTAFDLGKEYGEIYNRPVLTQNDIPTNLGGGTNESEIWFGDLSYYYVGDREQMAAETSTQEGQSFEKHRAAVKVTERLDGQLALTEAFAKLTAVK